MELTVGQLGDWKTLTPDESRLDAYISEDFKRSLVGAIEDGTERLLIDLSSVDFMDSSGLSAIVFCLQRMKNGRIALAGARDAVRLMLKLTHIDRVLRLVENPEDVLVETTA